MRWNNVLKFIGVATVVILTAQAAFGQIEQPARFELVKMNNEHPFNVVSADEFGIALFKEKVGRNDEGDIEWQVVMLNTDLTNAWEKDFAIDKKFYFKGYEYRNNHLYLLFKKGPARKDDMAIVKINLTTGNDSRYEIDNELPMKLEEFVVVGESAVFAGYVNSMPTILQYDFKENRSAVVPGLYQRNSYLIDLNVDEVNNNFNVLTSERKGFREQQLTVRIINEKGKLLVEKKVDIGPGTNILSGKSTSIDGAELILTGTYGAINSDLAKGVYFVNISSSEDANPNYYEFGELNNYFNYLPDKRQGRVKSKIQEKRAKGKNPRIRSHMVMHELIAEQDEYIMLGEIYNMNYNNYLAQSQFGAPYWINTFNFGNRGYYRRYASNIENEEQVAFDYTHAIVLGFNSSGHLLWDNSVAIEDVVIPFVDQVVNVNTTNDQIALIYKHENELRSKIIDRGTVIEENLVNEIELKNEKDELRVGKDNLGGLTYWYEDHFFTWGYQRINNPEMKEKKKRNVFYINKISIR